MVLSSARKHGLENYPDFYTVNSSEATQIMGKAEDILKYMAYGPMSLVGLPEQITDDPKTYDKVKPKGDLRGLPTAIVYSTKVSRPMTPIHDLMKEDGVTDERLRQAVEFLRSPDLPSADRRGIRDTCRSSRIPSTKGKEDGVFMGLSAISPIATRSSA